MPYKKYGKTDAQGSYTYKLGQKLRELLHAKFPDKAPPSAHSLARHHTIDQLNAMIKKTNQNQDITQDLEIVW